MPIALWALAAGAFGIGTTEFVIMGLLPEVGADLGQQPHDDELGRADSKGAGGQRP
ncbi:hypothetical protein OMF40_04050 [Bordetella pertussis]